MRSLESITRFSKFSKIHFMTKPVADKRWMSVIMSASYWELFLSVRKKYG